ncbi:hypothetical protein [Photobacterium atrarenae]|uniref:Uncharacterized protein n=1 Tax=Photobacterium atrarenae TaxID=865757 RepID=A0ABY5GNH3_9GAMM|nr:hypothetical protein [Photobacterium atrarenae]UTV30311.1 hypothetical protein NNL38_17180 [Photobacterium atrarenae]
MSEKKQHQLLQLFLRESERVRLVDLSALPTLDDSEHQYMQHWLATKRPFSCEEVPVQHWLKTCSAGYVTEMIFHPDGTVEELGLFSRQKGTGTWQVNDGGLDIELRRGDDRYYFTVIANKQSSIHSAIEYKNHTLHSYLKLAQLHPVNM